LELDWEQGWPMLDLLDEGVDAGDEGGRNLLCVRPV